MGKVIIAFSLFLAASALAIHEAKPPPPPAATPAPVVDAAPVPEFHEPPPWVKWAPPKPATRAAMAAPSPPPPPSPPPSPLVITVEPPPIATEVIDGDLPDVADRCPDQPEDNRDDDGCPPMIEDRIILVE